MFGDWARPLQRADFGGTSEQDSFEAEPTTANDVFMVCQREITEHRFCNQKRKKIHGILRNKEIAPTQVDETIPTRDMIDDESHKCKPRPRRSTPSHSEEKQQKG